MKCLHGQFWPRYPTKDMSSPRERLVKADIGQLLRLLEWKDGYGYDCWSQSPDFTDFDQCIFRPKDSTWDSVNKKWSLQFVDGNHAQAESGQGFCQAKCSHIKGSMVGACNHAVSFPKLGLEWFPWWRLFGCFPGCKFIPSAASSLVLWSCPSQTVDKGLGSAIDMSLQDMWLACGRAAGWPARTRSSIALPLELNDAWKLFRPWMLCRNHLARKLFRVCCIQLGQRIVPNRDGVAFKKVKLQSRRYRPVFPRRSRFGLGKLCFSDSYLAHYIPDLYSKDSRQQAGSKMVLRRDKRSCSAKKVKLRSCR